LREISAQTTSSHGESRDVPVASTSTSTLHEEPSPEGDTGFPSCSRTDISRQDNSAAPIASSVAQLDVVILSPDPSRAGHSKAPTNQQDLSLETGQATPSYAVNEGEAPEHSQHSPESSEQASPTNLAGLRRSPRLATKTLSRRQLAPSTPVSSVRSPRLTPKEYRKKKRGSKTPVVVDGRRVVDLQFLHEQYVKLSKHGERFGCKLSHLVIVKEERTGFRSKFHFYCKNCHAQLQLLTSAVDGPMMDINSSMVSATLSAGIGYTQLEEMTSIVEVPCIADKTYIKISTEIKTHVDSLSTKELEEAGREEARLAREAGDIHADGKPMITVVTDGAWAQRSYGTNFSSSSGVAVILGYRTKKVLFFGVKNKYCCVCQRAENAKIDAPSHSCSKNWEGSSTGMESAIIAEGFKRSVEMHGLIYARFIGDGDSSTYRKILDASPYKSLVVEKLECSNHILRNYAGRVIKDVVLCTKRGSPQLRSLTKSRLLRLRTAVVKAASYRKDEAGASLQQKVQLLKDDITNSVYHVFGQHDKCAAYFCKGAVAGETNFVPDLEKAGMLVEIRAALSRVRDNAKSLLFSTTNNLAEAFNSIVAKLIAGKRINFARRYAYQMRCSAAAIQFNTKSFSSALHRKVIGRSPGIRLKKFTARTEKNRRRVAAKRRCFPSTSTCDPKRRRVLALPDADYGPNASAPSLELDNPSEYATQCAKFVESLQLSAEDRTSLERATVGQSTCAEWMSARRSRLTASNFVTPCRMRATTSTAKTVEKLLYGAPINSPAILWGREHEDVALEKLQIEKQISVEKCGLFVHLEHGFLGASPDGLVADGTTIVEVKCPFTARNMAISESVQQKKLIFWRKKPAHTLLKLLMDITIRFRGS